MTDAEQEAKAFTRFLLDREPSDLLVGLYRRALESLPALGEGDRGSRRLIALARRRPWVLPYLDSAMALVGKEEPLRLRLYALAALAECDPGLAGEFLLPPQGTVRLVLGLAARGLAMAAKTMAGVPLYWALRRMP